MKGHSVPLITLHSLCFEPPDPSHPTTTFGYEQLSLMGHARVLKVVAYGSTGRCKKERTKTKLRKDKNNGGRDKLPLISDFITKMNLKYSRM